MQMQPKPKAKRVIAKIYGGIFCRGVDDEGILNLVRNASFNMITQNAYARDDNIMLKAKL